MIVAEARDVPVSQLSPCLKNLLKERALGNPLAAISLAMAVSEEEEKCEATPPSLRTSSSVPVGEVAIPSNIFRLTTRELDRYA